jgi:hypothetical protein
VVSYLHAASQEGALWLLLPCLVMYVGVLVALRRPSLAAISSHPDQQPGDDNRLATDMPPGRLRRTAK